MSQPNFGADPLDPSAKSIGLGDWEGNFPDLPFGSAFSLIQKAAEDLSRRSRSDTDSRTHGTRLDWMLVPSSESEWSWDLMKKV